LLPIKCAENVAVCDGIVAEAAISYPVEAELPFHDSKHMLDRAPSPRLDPILPSL
jgi:hypothetical protein